MKRTLALLLLLTVAPAWAQAPARDSREIVRAYVAAFDRHEIDAVVALTHPEIAWMSVEADTLAPQLKGSEAVRDWLTGYFARVPNARSRLVEVGAGTRYISARECATSGKEGAAEQCSQSVYEIEQNKVRRVWYFPSEPLTP